MNSCGLIVLSFVLAFALVNDGGVETRAWQFCVLAIAFFTLAYRLRPRSDQAPPLHGKSQWLLLAFLGFGVLQVVPLPVSVIGLLSPARADLLKATGPVLGSVSFTTLSTAPAATVEQLTRAGSYLLVFLLLRDFMWGFRDSPWRPVLPLVLLATLEASLGLLQSFSPGSDGIARGNYVNRDHFAGFLEMCLPFAAAYPCAVLRRTRSKYISLAAAAKACGLLSTAAIIFVAILRSQSRMGFLVSLFVIAFLVLGAQRQAHKSWLAIGSLVTVMLLGFLLLPSDALISRFASLKSAEAISSDMRVGIWKDTFGLIRAFPLFGCGLGALESAFPRFQTVAPLYSIDFAHNDYLQYIAELGAPAFLVGMLFLLIVFRPAIFSGLNQPSGDRRYVVLACAGASLAIFLHSFVDFNLYIPANAMLLAWIAGILATPSLGFDQATARQRDVNVVCHGKPGGNW
jgi:O-antigen ligase